MEESRATSRRQRRILTVIALLLCGAIPVAYFGVRDSWAIAQRPSPDAFRTASAAMDEVVLPPGPHQTDFHTACVICHSPRLALNQPSLPREKWVEVVHKMVKVYGAPLTPAVESNVVDYLVVAQTNR